MKIMLRRFYGNNPPFALRWEDQTAEAMKAEIQAVTEYHTDAQVIGPDQLQLWGYSTLRRGSYVVYDSDDAYVSNQTEMDDYWRPVVGS